MGLNMRFFRWLLSNILLIIIIIGLSYTYVYWGNLTGSSTPVSKAISYLSNKFVDVREFVNAIKVKKLSGDHPSDNATHTTAGQSALAHASMSHSPASEETPQQPIQIQPVTISYSHNHQRIQQNSNGQILRSHKDTGVNNLLLSSAKSTSARQSIVKKKPVMPAVKTRNKLADMHRNSLKNSAQKSPPASARKSSIRKNSKAVEKLHSSSAKDNTTALTPDAIRAIWMAARKSFYRRDYVQSEKQYKHVISITKNNFDAYGELGNVYFNQGKNNQAADAYMNAAVILVKQGQINRARGLLGLMQYLDKGKAQKLRQKIDAAQ